MGRQGDALVVVLQFDTPPHSLVTLTFDLASEPAIDRDALPPEHRTPDSHVEWMYDEWERLPGDPPTWALTILLSNGWEVRRPFRDVQVQEAQSLLPAPPLAAAGLLTTVSSHTSP